MSSTNILLMAGVLVTACDGSEQLPLNSSSVVQDVGSVCLYADSALSGEPQAFEAGQPVHIIYRLESMCLSSTCNQMSVSCAVASGSEQKISSLVSWSKIQEADQTICSDDCRIPTALCETLPLPAGDHSFEFGSSKQTLTVPSQVVSPLCLEVPEKQ